jgi:hypothetical protein
MRALIIRSPILLGLCVGLVSGCECEVPLNPEPDGYDVFEIGVDEICLATLAEDVTPPDGPLFASGAQVFLTWVTLDPGQDPSPITSAQASPVAAEGGQQVYDFDAASLRIEEKCRGFTPEQAAAGRLLEVDVTLTTEEERDSYAAVVCVLDRGTVLLDVKLGPQSDDPWEIENPLVPIDDIFNQVIGVNTIVFEGRLPAACPDLERGTTYATNAAWTLQAVKAPE